MSIGNLIVWAFILIAAIAGDVWLLPKWLSTVQDQGNGLHPENPSTALQARSFQLSRFDLSSLAAWIKRAGPGWLANLAAFKPSIRTAQEPPEVSSRVQVTPITGSPETNTDQSSHIQIQVDLAPGETVHITIESRPKN